MTDLIANNRNQPNLTPLKVVLSIVLIIIGNILFYHIFESYNLVKLYFISLIAQFGLVLINILTKYNKC